MVVVVGVGGWGWAVGGGGARPEGPWLGVKKVWIAGRAGVMKGGGTGHRDSRIVDVLGPDMSSVGVSFYLPVCVR